MKKPRVTGAFHTYFGRCRLRWQYTHSLAILAALGFEDNLAIGLGEQGVILADADIHTGMYLGATLPYQDITGDNGFTAKALHAKAFAF